MKQIIDEYRECPKKVHIGLHIDQHHLDYLKRLAQINQNRELDNTNLSQLIRHSIELYLRYKLGHQYPRIQDEDFKRRNERTGHIHNTSRW